MNDPECPGHVPAFGEPLHVGRPNLANRDAFLQRVGQVLDNQWLTNNGPLVQELEQRLAERLGVKNCVAMCNGTIALEIAIREGRRAWKPGVEPSALSPLLIGQLQSGDIEGARTTLRLAKANSDPSNLPQQRVIAWMQSQVASHRGPVQSESAISEGPRADRP